MASIIQAEEQTGLQREPSGVRLASATAEKSQVAENTVKVDENGRRSEEKVNSEQPSSC